MAQHSSPKIMLNYNMIIAYQQGRTEPRDTFVQLRRKDVQFLKRKTAFPQIKSAPF